jgi:glyoxylase-like metal-dependent hydrolase (beta-lactamase superfamily II)
MATELLEKVELGRGPAETEVAHDVECVRTGIVNCFLVGEPGAGDRGWVLVDAGMYGFTHTIVRKAAERFGADARPAAIVMTHGHFDHVGGLKELAELWDAPVYAHEIETPYLTGRSAYPPPDPTVGGGMMAAMSLMYPRGPIDLGERVHELPYDGSVPGMPGWHWVHTPGHTPGHVSLFREADAVLIAGDAFVTTKQESLIAALSQRPEMHGPPMYYTPDWEDAARSVRRLANLEPEIAATGHGHPMHGREMREALHRLADDFEHLALPAHGRYVHRPAVADEYGVVSVPPLDTRSRVILGVGAATLAGLVVAAVVGKRRS